MGGLAMEVGERDSWHNLVGWQGSGDDCSDWIGPPAISKVTMVEW